VKIFIVLAHPEHQSFNGAMFRTAVDTLSAAGHGSRRRISMPCSSTRCREGTTSCPPRIRIISSSRSRSCTRPKPDCFAGEIENEIQKIECCDLMIRQFPLWWFALPGLLKGWVDRVFAMGRTYGGDRIYANGVFKGKRAMLSLTTGGSAPAYAKGGFNGDIHAILRPIQRGMLQFVGFEVLAPQIAYGPVRLQPGQRTELLTAYAQRLKDIASETPVDIGIY
jgi:NAD(P)H dehydrogenase (quinone)